MIKWIFCRDEKNIQSEIKDFQDDIRIKEFIKNSPTGVLFLEGGDTNVYVNLNNVSWIIRQEIKDDPEVVD